MGQPTGSVMAFLDRYVARDSFFFIKETVGSTVWKWIAIKIIKQSIGGGRNDWRFRQASEIVDMPAKAAKCYGSYSDNRAAVFLNKDTDKHTCDHTWDTHYIHGTHTYTLHTQTNTHYIHTHTLYVIHTHSKQTHTQSHTDKHMYI